MLPEADAAPGELPAARAAGRGCAAGALDFYYYSIPGGCSGLYGRSPCAAGSELAAAPGAGCAGSSSEDCDTAPLLQEPVHCSPRVLGLAGVRARRRLHLPPSYSTTVRHTMFRCPGPPLGSALWFVSPVPTKGHSPPHQPSVVLGLD